MTVSSLCETEQYSPQPLPDFNLFRLFAFACAGTAPLASNAAGSPILLLLQNILQLNRQIWPDLTIEYHCT